MPDIANRTDREQKLATLLRRAIGRNRAALLDALGDPPDVRNIPDELWEQLQADIEDDSRRALVVMFLVGMDGMEFDDPSTEERFRPDSDTAGERAAAYANSRAADLARGMAGTVRDQLRTAVDQASNSSMTPRQTLATLNTRLREIAQNQAEAAGVTEVTSANSAGEVWYKRLYEAETGVALLGTWATEHDSKVCRVCRELDRADERTWSARFPDGPPAHPNCRCYLIWTPQAPDDFGDN